MKGTKILAILVVAVISVSLLATVEKPEDVPKGKGWDQVWDALLVLQGQIDTRTDAVYVHTEGNIGIGTTEPAHKLDVRGNIHASGAIGAGEGSLYLNQTEDAITTDSGEIYLGSESGNFEDVKVGIGTTNPIYTLDQASGKFRLTNSTASDSYIDLQSSGDFIVLADGSTSARFWDNGDISLGNLYVVDASAGYNVGIGTMSPAGELDVNGSIYQRGSVLHADYVFEPGYQLESIDEHSEFMWANKHLAAIPEAETDEAGQEIVEVGAHRKGIVEELEKAHIYIEQLHKRIKALEEKLVKLEAGLSAGGL